MVPSCAVEATNAPIMGKAEGLAKKDRGKGRDGKLAVLALKTDVACLSGTGRGGSDSKPSGKRECRKAVGTGKGGGVGVEEKENAKTFPGRGEEVNAGSDGGGYSYVIRETVHPERNESAGTSLLRGKLEVLDDFRKNSPMRTECTIVSRSSLKEGKNSRGLYYANQKGPMGKPNAGEFRVLLR